MANASYNNYTNELNRFLTDLSIKFSFSISSVGAIFDFICILVFIQMIRTNLNLKNIKSIKFLLFKSAVECIHNTNRFVLQCTECSQCWISTRYHLVAFRLFLINYVAMVCALMSIMTEIVANLDRLMAIIDHKKYSKYLNVYYSLGFIIAYPSLFYIFKFFDTYIEPSFDAKTNATYFFIKSSKLPVYDYLRLIHSIVRDVICVSLVFIINILLLIRFRTLLKRKKAIQQNMNKKKNGDETTRKENNLTIMLVIMGFICIIGHIPIFIRYIPIAIVKTLSDTTDWFIRLAEDFFYVSISLNFFIYMIFDSYFKKTFIGFFYKRANKDAAQCVSITNESRLNTSL